MGNAQSSGSTQESDDRDYTRNTNKSVSSRHLEKFAETGDITHLRSAAVKIGEGLAEEKREREAHTRSVFKEPIASQIIESERSRSIFAKFWEDHTPSNTEDPDASSNEKEQQPSKNCS